GAYTVDAGAAAEELPECAADPLDRRRRQRALRHRRLPQSPRRVPDVRAALDAEGLDLWRDRLWRLRLRHLSRLDDHRVALHGGRARRHGLGRARVLGLLESFSHQRMAADFRMTTASRFVDQPMSATQKQTTLGDVLSQRTV